MAFLYQACNLYNCADDKRLAFHIFDFDKIIKVLQDESKKHFDWVCFNCMQAKPNKFQVIGVGK